MVSSSFSKLSIVLVEDNPTFAQAVRQFLSLLSRCEVVAHAASGPQAIALTLNHQPDLLLLDISLGGMSGFDIAKQMATLTRAPALVFLTMHDQPAYREQARALGALGFVLKDHFVEDLPPVLDHLMASREPPAPTLDRAVLGRMTASNPVRFEKYSALFRSSMEDVLLQVDAACEGKDMASLQAMGHRGKSTAINIGAAELSRQCTLLELAGKARNEAAALQTAKNLRTLYNEACAALQAQPVPPVSA